VWAAGLSLCLVAVAAVVLTRDTTREVVPGSAGVPRASPAAATAALQAFVAGVEARDADSLAALAPEGDEEARSTLDGIGRNAEALDLRDVSARYVDQVGVVAADGSWTGLAELTWRMGEYDPGPAMADVAVEFAPSRGELSIAGFDASDPGTRTPLWLRGELAVSKAPGVLVMVDGPQADADATAERVTRGVDVVQRVLPDWKDPVVVEVPASAADLAETLGVEASTYASVAAVTTAEGESLEEGAPIHVFVNPEVTDGLRRAGAQVVMSHELVHLATDAVRSDMEPWLLEGFADYVALRDVALPDRVTLSRAIDWVRRNGVPKRLPTAADFDTRSGDLQAHYEMAWLACRIIAERLGEERLIEVYGAASVGEGPEKALRRAQLMPITLTSHWRSRLIELAGMG
jgi:hypothetical protein